MLENVLQGGSLDLCAFVVSSKKDFLQSDNT